MEKWRVEFASSADCHPVKLACQLTANNLLDASSAGRSIADNESRNMCSPITNLQFLFCFPKIISASFCFLGEEAVGERLYGVERYLSKTHKLLN